MNRKLHRELIKEASRFHFWHNWHPINNEPKKVTLKTTDFGTLTTHLKQRRCMGCGKEEYIEIEGGYAHRFGNRKWTPTPTTQDTLTELFGLPPHSDSSDCECGCQNENAAP